VKINFNQKISNLTNSLLEYKNEFERSEKNIINTINERHEAIMKKCEQLKQIGSEEVDKITERLNSVIKQDPKDQRIEWFKKQLNELIPFKNKCQAFEINLTKLETNEKKLKEKIDNLETLNYSLQKVCERKENKVEDLRKYVQNIEAKLCDVKDFVFKNFPESVEDFMAYFQVYYNVGG
jgi:chromosome segregation ATPase